jgi:L-aminopeptidase/D-esterase-like protein
MTRRIAVVAWLAAGVLLITTTPSTGQIAATRGTGTNNAITDVPGIELGHSTDRDGMTGATVIFAPDQAVGGVDVRGGWPGTVETDLLDPRNLVHRVNAIVLAGGSIFGLEARTGVMRCLEEQSEGFAVGFTPEQVVPIVPGAVIHDLARDDLKARPSAESGYEACTAAASGPVEQGNVGAGTGAVTGGFKTGFGTASADLGGGIIVGAAVAVGAVGLPFRSDTCELFVSYLEVDDEFGAYQRPSASECGASPRTAAQSVGGTIGVVATNVALDKAQAQKMAGIAQDGIARAVHPSHTLRDGDVAFALSTGSIDAAKQCLATTPGLTPTLCALVVNDVLAAAADAMSRAVVHAILAARSTDSAPSYCDAYGSGCASAGTSKRAARLDRARGRTSTGDRIDPSATGATDEVPGGVLEFGFVGMLGALAGRRLRSYRRGRRTSTGRGA